MSAAGPASPPLSCSGAMYAAVPTTKPLRVILVVSAAVAMPRSASFATPSPRRRMLPGLTSRCTTPPACAWSRAAPMSLTIDTTAGGSSGPRASASLSVSPSTYSMTMSTSSASQSTS